MSKPSSQTVPRDPEASSIEALFSYGTVSPRGSELGYC